MVRRLCDWIDGPDGKLVCIAAFVILAMLLVVHDAYASIERRRDR